MTNKSNLTHQKLTLSKGKNPEPLQNKEKFLSIDEKMQRLRKKRERLHLNESLFFTKEIQKILGEDYSLETALVAFEKTWRAASNNQKKEWNAHRPYFRSELQSHHQEPEQNDSASQSNGISEVHSHELS